MDHLLGPQAVGHGGLTATEEGVGEHVAHPVQAVVGRHRGDQVGGVAVHGLTGCPGPTMGPYTDERDIMKEGLEALLLEGASPEDVQADMQERVTEALATYEDQNF